MWSLLIIFAVGLLFRNLEKKINEQFFYLINDLDLLTTLSGYRFINSLI